MKRFTGMLLAFALLLPGLTTFANSSTQDGPKKGIKVKSTTNEDGQLEVRLINLQKEDTTVKLEDMDGNEYYRKLIRNHNGFARSLDLNDLANGRYMLTVAQDGQKWVQVVLIDDDTVRLSKVVAKS